MTPEGAEADTNAVANPTHWAVVLYEDTTLCDVETGEIVDEDTVDWTTTEAQPDVEPAERLRHAKTVTETTVFAPEYYCLDYRAAGLSLGAWFARRAGMVDTNTGEVIDLDQARESARQQAEAQRAETEKRERRKVLALNRLSDAALKVRRDFVKKLVARKTAPKGAAMFIADCLARDSFLLTTPNALDTTAALLGVDSGQAVAKLAAELPANGDGRAQVITLAVVLGALESRTLKDCWRNNSGGGVRHVGSGEYLRWLANNDYPLAPVEEIVTKTKDAEEVYEQYLAEAVKE